MILSEMSHPELEDHLTRNDPTAVLPTGATEQHGPHLPFAVDIFLADQVVKAACENSHDCALPPIPFGYNEKELTFAGTVSLRAETFLSMIVDIGQSLRKSGWRRFVIINGHGWNNDLIRVATHVLNEEPGFTASCCSYWSLCTAEVAELRQSPIPGGMAHACEFETSLMLHRWPASVRCDMIQDEISYQRSSHHHHDLLNKSPMFMPERFELLSRSGVIGSPSAATSEKGALWFNATVGHLRRFLSDFRSQYPRKTETVSAGLQPAASEA
jgi:creatinine amidohydrolase